MAIKNTFSKHLNNIIEELNIKNLTIENIVNKKYKLSKVVVPYVLVTSIGLGIWAYNHDLFNVSASVNPTSSYETIDEEVPFEYIYKREGQYANNKVTDYYQVTPINLTASSYQYFNDFLKNDHIYFPYDEIFNYEKYAAYFQNPRRNLLSHTYSGFIYDNKVDEEKLYATVIANNSHLVTQNHQYKIIANEQVLRKIITHLATSINEGIQYKTSLEIAELDCVLGQLSILTSSLVDKINFLDNGIIIPEAYVTSLDTLNDNNIIKSLYHIAKNFEQIDCVDRKDSLYHQTGLSRTIDNYEVNPYQWTWTTDGAAETGSMRLSDGLIQRNRLGVSFTELLDLASLPSPYSKYGGSIEIASTNRDLNTFYNLTGLNNGLSDEEITKMMYSIEIISGGQFNFFDAYYEKYGLFDTSNFLQNYRRQALLVASKIFYNNLALSLMTNDNMTLEDINCLISTYEATLSYHTNYGSHNETIKEETQSFIQEYNKIQKKFFEVIALDNNLEQSTLIKTLNNYCMYRTTENGDMIINAELDWLNDNQKEWLKNKLNSPRIKFTHPMNTLVEIINQQKLLLN